MRPATLVPRKSRAAASSRSIIRTDDSKENNAAPPSSRSTVPPQPFSLRKCLFMASLLIICWYLYHHSTNEEHTGAVQSKLKAFSLAAMSQPDTADENKKAVSLATDDEKDQHNRFVTIVMPSVVNPKGRRQRLEAIAETWGPASQAIYVIHSLEEEYPVPATDAKFPQVLQVPANITFDDGLPRLYYVIRQAYQDYKTTDFFFFVNDHTYVIPEHLCFYLKDFNPDHNMYDGHALKNEKEAFNSGAAGYILSRETMRRLIKSFDDKDPTCIISGNKWLQGNPGLVTAQCLHHVLDTKARDTRAAKTYHRFHAFGLVRMAMGKVDQWYRNKHEKLRDILGFDASYATLLQGPDCCSEETISFHYVEFTENRALFAIRQELLKNPTMSNDDLQTLVLKLYPQEWKQLGGYSRLLPNTVKEKDAWSDILAVYRKISMKEYDMQC